MVHGAARLVDVHPDLVTLVNAVGAERDVMVAQGARTVADEQADIAAGRSHLTNPMDSKHVIGPGRAQAEAVDLTPVPPDWNARQEFYDLADAVKAKAVELGMQISWGGDWPHPFDFDHFERGTGPA